MNWIPSSPKWTGEDPIVQANFLQNKAQTNLHSWSIQFFLEENSFYPPEVSGVFQFEPQNLKIGNLPPEVLKIFNLKPQLIFSI
jgi:hypothetical protein